MSNSSVTIYIGATEAEKRVVYVEPGNGGAEAKVVDLHTGPVEENRMASRFTIVALAVAVSAISLPSAAMTLDRSLGASMPASPYLLRIEHDHSDGSGRRESRSDSDQSENDGGRRRDFSHADRGDDRGENADGRSGGAGASFSLRSGDLRLDVKCSRGESMRACVDAALTLLDKARSTQNQSSSSPPAQGR